MIAPKKNRTVFLIAAWGAIAAYPNRSGPISSTTSPFSFSFCSGWTMEPGFRRRWHPNNPPKRQRHVSRLFSASPAMAPSTTAESTAYRDLFPASDTIKNGTLQTGEGSLHTLYYEVHGTGPLTALFLHGGPGAGCFPNHARFFDPTKYTVVLLDQRGAGKSTPSGCVEDNTLDFLVEDCERLRKHLLRNNSAHSDAPWDVVLGGSWGATLGLAYSQKYPSALRSLVLRGICALRHSEVDWLFGAKGGSAQRLPEAWKNFSDAVGTNTLYEEENTWNGREALHAYYDCLLNTEANGTANNALRLAAARSWMGWEMGVTSSGAQTTTNNNTNQSNPSEGAVLVSSPGIDGGNWRFENYLGMPVVGGMDQSPEMVASQLRRKIATNSNNERLLVSSPRPVKPVEESMPLLASIREASTKSNGNNNKTFAGRFRLPPDYVPAQAMLTCYYSVNDQFVMGNKNLLETASFGNSNSNNSTPVKIIGIQGGKDPICPPDTALELLQSLQTSTDNMELRIPLESGHSMYDPGIKHELVKVTDQLADEFLNQ